MFCRCGYLLKVSVTEWKGSMDPEQVTLMFKRSPWTSRLRGHSSLALSKSLTSLLHQQDTTLHFPTSSHNVTLLPSLFASVSGLSSRQGRVIMGKKRRRASEAFAELPEGCHHYENLAEVPWDIQKYAPGVVLPGTPLTCTKILPSALRDLLKI